MVWESMAMAMERGELAGSPQNEVPAVLQLHSWDSLGVPVSAFSQASLSPSRELLLLQTYDRDLFLLSLGGRSKASPNPLSLICSDPESAFRELNPPSTSPSASASSLATENGSRTVSSIAALGSNSSKSSSPDNYRRQNSPITAHSPLFIPPSTSPYSQGGKSPSAAGPSESSSSPLSRFLCAIDYFAWASHGDGFGAEGPNGQFKEMLFTSNRDGLSIHCLSRKFAAGGRQRESKKSPEKANSIGLRREGNSNMDGVGDASESFDFERGHSSYSLDAELEESGGGLQMRFSGPHSWPSSAEIVSFKFPVSSPSYSLLMFPNSKKFFEITDSMSSEESNAGEAYATSTDEQRSLQIVDIISNPFYTLIGIVAADWSDQGEDIWAKEARDGACGDRRLEWRKLQNALVSIILVLDWGIKCVAAIDLNKSLSKVAVNVPWTAVVLASDKLLGLREDGGVYVWAAADGDLVAFIDVMKHCGLAPVIPNEVPRMGDSVGQNASFGGDGQLSPQAFVNGEANIDGEGSSGRQHKSRRCFTKLTVTANCLLLVVCDNGGLQFLVSVDEYFASRSSRALSPPAPDEPDTSKEDLEEFLYWDTGGSDIGRSLPTTLIPDRRFQRFLQIEQEDDKTRVKSTAAQFYQKMSDGGKTALGRSGRSQAQHVATGFTSKVEVARNQVANVSSEPGKYFRRVFLPNKRSGRPAALALSLNVITTMEYLTQGSNSPFTIKQNAVRILDGMVDERDSYNNGTHKYDRSQKSGNFFGDVVSFCSQGFLYLMTATSLHVVLPSLASWSQSASSQIGTQEQHSFAGVSVDAQLGWHTTRMATTKDEGTVTKNWQAELLDRALVCDGLEEAELLCLENGWSLQILHLRRLQLAVDFVRIEDVKGVLEALVHVGAAESGVLCVLFAAVELMLNQHCSDSELSQASKLLSSASSFTTRLVRQLGIRGWQERSQQWQQMPSNAASLESSRYKTSAALNELTRFLEVSRTLQVHLQSKRKGPNFMKGLSRSQSAMFSPDAPYLSATLESIEEGVEDKADGQEPGSSSSTELNKSRSHVSGELSSYESSHLGTSPSRALVATGAYGSGASWEVSPTSVDGGKSRRRSHMESPSDMVARWENENVDAAGVVRDALKSSGRLALAVAQLHRLRMESGRGDSQNEGQADVFNELLTIGRGIVYELFCKGKTALAMAALRRLGEDIESALRDLALGAVGRYLHAQAVKELQRLARFSANDFLLFERVSAIEDNYTNSSFWSAYENRSKPAGADAAATGLDNSRIVCRITAYPDLSIECGEVDGVVLGSWSMIDDSAVSEEIYGAQDPHSTGYWAAAVVWLQPWDQLNIDRILLEKSLLQEQAITWEAKLEFYITHMNWPAVMLLLQTIPSSLRGEAELMVHLNSEDDASDRSLPFPGASDSAIPYGPALLEDGKRERAVIPRVHILHANVAFSCNTLMWQQIEEKLVKSLTFIRWQWKGTLELMSLFARGGLLFHDYSLARHRGRDASHHATVLGPTKGVKLHKDAVLAVHELVVQHCVRYKLAHFLELYLDFHSLAGLDKVSSTGLQGLLGDCQWALWLIYSARQRREYDASFANALTVLAASKVGSDVVEDKDMPQFLRTVDDMAKAGGEIMALSTLMYAPVPIQKCLCIGSVSKNADSWECTVECLEPRLDRYPTLWMTLYGVCFGHHRQGFVYEQPVKVGKRDKLVQYVEWHQSLFSCGTGETSLLQMMPRWLPQGVRRLLYVTIQGPAARGQLPLSKRRDIQSEVSSPPGGRRYYGGNVKLQELETVVLSWDASVQSTVKEKLWAPSCEDSGQDCAQYVRRGHALAAFNTVLGARVKDLKTGYGRLHSAEIQALSTFLTAHEEKILAPVIPLVITHYENTVVVAAFAVLVELCGYSASLVRIDIASLRRISNYEKSDQFETAFGTVGTGSSSKTVLRGSAHGVGDVASSLAGSLAQEYMHTGVGVLSPSYEVSQTESYQKTILTIQQVLERASLKDEGMKRVEGVSPGAWLFSGHGDGLLLRTMQWSTSESWSLVTAFCRAHGLPLSTTYLENLARDNDWVGFLAEAQLEGCPLDVLLPVVSNSFTNTRLQSQLLFVLKNLPGASEKSTRIAADLSTAAVPSEAFATAGVNAELFTILADCQGNKRPGKTLLAKADELQWPLLAVVASCFPDVSPESCLTTWLEVTIVKETPNFKITDNAEKMSSRVGAAVDSTNANAAATGFIESKFVFSRKSNNKRSRLSLEGDDFTMSAELQAIHDRTTAAGCKGDGDGRNPSWPGEPSFPMGRTRVEVAAAAGLGDGGQEQEDSLAAFVASLCEQQRFLPLLRAFELFTPTSSFLPFLRFLHAFSQMRISEASAHLAAFAASLREEMMQQQQHTSTHSNSSGKSSNTAWITKAAIAAADAMHEACPSAYERRCLLQLLSGSDFGDGGVAAMRFRRLFWKIQLAEPALQEGPDVVGEGANLDDKELFDTLEKGNHWEQARSWARQLDPTHSTSALHHVTETQAEAMVSEWKELLWDVPEERIALWDHCEALFTMHAFPALRAGVFFLRHADAVEAEVPSSEVHNILMVALQWLSGCNSKSAPVYPSHLLHELETRVWLLAVESTLEAQHGLGGDSPTPSSLHYTRSTGGELSHEMPAASPVAVEFVERTAAKISEMDSHLKKFSSFEVDANPPSWSSDIAATSSSYTANNIAPKSKRQQHTDRTQQKSVYSEDESRKGSENCSEDGSRSGAAVIEGQATTFLDLQHVDGEGSTTTREEETRHGWDESVGEREAEHAVLALLEVGQVAAAKQLQQKLSLAHVPRELSLVDACLKVAALTSTTSTANGSAISSVLPPDAVEYLQSLGLLEDVIRASAADVLERLTEACREKCGRGECLRISAIARIAGVLGLTFSEAYAKSARDLLHMLALKGQDALTEAKLLVATHSIPLASIARILAESFLKGLLAAHRGGYLHSSQKEEGPAPLLWRPSDFIRWAQVCPSEAEIGHALMRLVISERDMPHACEVELIILAYRYYESSACLDGMDVLVALAVARVESYISEGDYPSLARLITGISNFQALHFILEFLIENGQLELLLQKRSAVDATMESSASIRGFCMAVLSALKRFNPRDLDAFAMVYSNFSMAHEMAALLESRGERSNKQWTDKQYDTEQNGESIEAMRFYVEAAEVYSGIDAGNKTSWCCAQASLISLQLRMPDHNWLNLSDTNARRLVIDQFRFQEAYIVAEAYGLNQPADWAPVIWSQMLVPGGRIDQFLNDFVTALPLTHSMLMELARFYRADVSARGDGNHLDFSKWLTPVGISAEAARHLNKSFRSLLKHTRDMKERLQLATVATGFPDVVDACLRNIDNMPVTAGPLILRKGHGGTYLPIM